MLFSNTIRVDPLGAEGSWGGGSLKQNGGPQKKMAARKKKIWLIFVKIYLEIIIICIQEMAPGNTKWTIKKNKNNTLHAISWRHFYSKQHILTISSDALWLLIGCTSILPTSKSAFYTTTILADNSKYLLITVNIFNILSKNSWFFWKKIFWAKYVFQIYR